MGLGNSYKVFLKSLEDERKRMVRNGVADGSVPSLQAELHKIDMNILAVESMVGLAPPAEKEEETFELDRELVEKLYGIGLTKNQASTSTFLIQKKRPVKAPNISKTLGIGRTQIYHLLKVLEEEGFVSSLGTSLRDYGSRILAHEVIHADQYFALHPVKALSNYMKKKIFDLSLTTNTVLEVTTKYFESPTKVIK